MCRFVAYLGKKPILLNKILNDSDHSLIEQSHLAHETKTGLNADGFGVGWYDLEVDNLPAVFRSIQPAWNDRNLLNIASKVRSTCFIGHVRASTVGEVTLSNCHPFSFGGLLFAHNGTIGHFQSIKRDFLALLDDAHFSHIKGQTDSEHFFHLVSNILVRDFPIVNASTMGKALTQAIQIIDGLLEKNGVEKNYRINAVLTNGTESATVRYVSTRKKVPLSLYYSLGPHTARQSLEEPHDALVVASERLTNFRNEWQEIPPNHILLATADLNLDIISLAGL